MKLLLYCTKAKPYLIRFGNEYGYNQFDTSYCKDEHISPYEYGSEVLNGKIVAECDFKIEKYLIGKVPFHNSVEVVNKHICEGVATYSNTDKMLEDILNNSCLNIKELTDYMRIKEDIIEQKDLYAIHIRNLHIFDKPKELSDYYKIEDVGGMLFTKTLTNAPQNMMRVSINHWDYMLYNPDDIRILISIKPEWLCEILNKEKTIEVRKKILRGMLGDA